MNQSFWKRNSKLRRVAETNIGSAHHHHRYSNDPSAIVVRNFLQDIEDGRILGGEITISTEAVVELELRIFNAMQNSDYRKSLFQSINGAPFVEPVGNYIMHYDVPPRPKNPDDVIECDDDDDHYDDIPF